MEKPLTDIGQMVDDIFPQIRDKLHTPYAIYGHSLGSLLTYLVTIRIIREGLNKPVHLFVSGRGGPSVPRKGPPASELPRPAFIDKLKELGGFPDDLLNDEDVMNFFEPILRSDFRGVETYRYTGPGMLDLPITVMIGKDEMVTYEDACEWKKETTKDVQIKVFPGKHFFIFNYPKEIVQIISSTLGVS